MNIKIGRVRIVSDKALAHLFADELERIAWAKTSAETHQRVYGCCLRHDAEAERLLAEDGGARGDAGGRGCAGEAART